MNALHNTIQSKIDDRALSKKYLEVRDLYNCDHYV